MPANENKHLQRVEFRNQAKARILADDSISCIQMQPSLVIKI